MNYMLREFSTRENQISELKVSREDDGLRLFLSHSCCRVADFSVMLNCFSSLSSASSSSLVH